MVHYTPNAWRDEEDATLRAMVFTHSHAEIGAMLGRSEKSVRNHAWRLGLRKAADEYSAEEIDIVRRHYVACQDGVLDLRSLAKRLGRPHTSVAKIAKSLGLTNQKRDKVARLGGLTAGEQRRLPVYGTEGSDALRAAQSSAAKARIEKYGHPRGALGMKHTTETKAILSAKSRDAKARMTPEQKEAVRVKMIVTNIERFGVPAPIVLQPEAAYSRGHGGKREDLDNRYFRSRWEANYARYLRWLKEQGQIAAWEYEPQTFVFAGVTRGVLSYTPDFKVVELDGSYRWHEIKGWMDPKSKAKLKRMAKFYPMEQIVVIGEDEYKALAKWKALIPEWETAKRR